MIELKGLQHITVLAESRNFVRAAQILGISQPSLTRSIQALERQLGVLLFNRLSPQLAPTEICTLIVDRGKDILERSEELSDLIRRRKRMQKGHVSVGTGMYAKHALMDSVIAKYTAKFPDVRLDLNSSNWTVCRELLNQQKIDLFIGEADEEIPSPLFGYHFLRRRQGYIVVRRDHPLTKIADLKFDHVAEYPLAGTKVPRRLFNYFPSSARLGEVDTEHAIFDPHFEGHMWEDMVTLVTSTNAVTFGTPTSVSKYNGQLVCLNLLLPWLHTNGAMIWRLDAGHSTEIEAFVNIARSVDESIDPQS